MATAVTGTFCDTNNSLCGRLRGLGTSSVEESNSESVAKWKNLLAATNAARLAGMVAPHSVFAITPAVLRATGVAGCVVSSV